MSRELMQKALDALNAGIAISPGSWIHDEMGKALAAPQPAQPEREPGVWPIDGSIAKHIADEMCVSYEVVQLIARRIIQAAPKPQNKPLTDEQIELVAIRLKTQMTDVPQLANALRYVGANGIKEQS